MKSPRVSDVYVTALLLLVIATGLVYSYSLYYGLVQVNFHVQVYAYKNKQAGGDYAQVINESLAVSFMRTIRPSGNNGTTVIAYSTGELDNPLSMSLNLTLTYLANGLTFPVAYSITFTRPGDYTVSFNHLLRNLPAGSYLVNMTYTEGVYEFSPRQIWDSVVYYYDVE